MQYVLLLKAHANARYAQSLRKLAAAECDCLMKAISLENSPAVAEIGGVPWLTFDAEPLDAAQWATLSRHSSVTFAAAMENGLLRPLTLATPAYLPDELAQVLKYKGKTNVEFTLLMLNCARAVSDFAREPGPLTVLDPMCGRGTTLFAAVQTGDNAVGIDTDERAIAEADVYLARFLKYHRLKHRREECSLTLPGGGSAKERRYTLAATPEGYKAGDTRCVRLIACDASARALKRESCHIAAVDLPYGVQHAPKEGRALSSIEGLLRSALPAWREALRMGGALAVSFNTYTLPRPAVLAAVKDAGLEPIADAPDFEHWVEQAVQRDLVLAKKTR